MSTEHEVLQNLHKEIYDKLANADISTAERIGILEGVKYCLQRHMEDIDNTP